MTVVVAVAVAVAVGPSFAPQSHGQTQKENWEHGLAISRPQRDLAAGVALSTCANDAPSMCQ